MKEVFSKINKIKKINLVNGDLLFFWIYIVFSLGSIIFKGSDLVLLKIIRVLLLYKWGCLNDVWFLFLGYRKLLIFWK